MFGNGKTPKVAAQTVANLREIWKKLDPTFSLFPNQLAAHGKLEDIYFIPLYLKIKENSKRGQSTGEPYMKPSTVMGKLASIKSLINFSVSRDVFIGKYLYDYIKRLFFVYAYVQIIKQTFKLSHSLKEIFLLIVGLSYEDLDALRRKIVEIHNRLKEFHKSRER